MNNSKLQDSAEEHSDHTVSSYKITDEDVSFTPLP